MPTSLDPIPNNWYSLLDKGQQFKVVTVDGDSETVSIQYFDGDIEEMDFSEWRTLNIRLSEQPENRSGPMDIDEYEDFGTGITDTSEKDWNKPLRQFDRPEHEKLDADLSEPERPVDIRPEELPFKNRK